MRTSSRARTFGVLAAAALALTGCGEPGSGGGQADPEPAGTSALPVCEPVAGETLVVLEDDRGLQNADNVVAAVNADVAQEHPEVVELLDEVARVLDTDRLVELNRAVDVERRTSSEVAAELVESEGLADGEDVGGGASLTVGAANFSESITLAEVYAAVLRGAGFDARARTVGARETYLPALRSGELAVVPEYAATLATFLNAEVNGADAEPVASSDVDETMAALADLAASSGLVVGEASAAQDQNAFAVTAEFAAEHDLTTLSDLAAACGGVVLAGPPECPERPFCQIGLEETYGLQVGEFRSYDFALIAQAVRQGDAALGLVTSSDGTLAAG